jgi:alcohol oxidase
MTFDSLGLDSHLYSMLDAGIKWRPKPSEVAELGPEFQEYWESYFANAPDKPVLWIGECSGFVLRLT